MRKLLSLALCLMPVPALATPGQVGPEPGLPDPAAVAQALASHPGVEAANARTRAAEAELRVLEHGPYDYNLQTSYNRRSIVQESIYDEFEAQLTKGVRWPAKVRLDREIGQYGLTAQKNRAEDVRHQTALMLADYWWAWLSAASEAQVDRDSVANYQTLLSAVKRRVELRDAAVLEQDQTVAALEAARLAAERSSGREAVARSRLQAQFPAMELPDHAPLIPSPHEPEGGLTHLRDLVFARSHEIAAAEATAHMADAGAERARADRIADPQVGVRVFSDKGGIERGAGLIFIMPFGNGRRSALADQAGANAAAAGADLQAVKRSLQETADSDLAGAQAALHAWERAEASRRAQDAALLKIRRGFQGGALDLSELLLAERQAQDAARAESIARSDAHAAITRLRIDSHHLWIGDDED